jgi:aquaporin-7
MEGPSFVNSGQYASDLIEKSGHHSGKAPNLNRYPSTPHTPMHRRQGNHSGYNFANTPYTPRRLPHSGSMHSMLHQTNRTQIWLADDTTKKLPIVFKSVHLRECFAEFLGTLMLCAFGLGVNNQVALSGEANGTWLSINICWGIGLLMGVYVAEGVSGAHLNPAVTFTHAMYGRLPWWKYPGYAFSQTFGAFVAAGLVYLYQYQNITTEDPDKLTMQANFATFPSDKISNLTAFYSEALATALLLLAIYAITDERNRGAGAVGTPFAFALLFMGLGMAFGMNTGYALNPARDFGPRLMTLCAGFGGKVFTAHSTYFWIPIFGPMLGGLIGAGAYILLVQIQHDVDEDDEEENV